MTSSKRWTLSESLGAFPNGEMWDCPKFTEAEFAEAEPFVALIEGKGGSRDVSKTLNKDAKSTDMYTEGSYCIVGYKGKF